MESGTSTFLVQRTRIRSALLVLGALVLFLAGLFLLLAPATA